MWYLKFILVAVFALVLYQDFKSRLVYWFLYPVIGVLVFTIQLGSVPLEIALTNLGFNLFFVISILAVGTAYIKFRKLELKSTIGLGDVLFFVFISFAFSIVSFLVLFVFSLVFSLMLHLVLNNRKKQDTVPLAGYMSLFFGVVYIASFCYNDTFLYAY